MIVFIRSRELQRKVPTLSLVCCKKCYSPLCTSALHSLNKFMFFYYENFKISHVFRIIPLDKASGCKRIKFCLLNRLMLKDIMKTSHLPDILNLPPCS